MVRLSTNLQGGYPALHPPSTFHVTRIPRVRARQASLPGPANFCMHCFRHTSTLRWLRHGNSLVHGDADLLQHALHSNGNQHLTRHGHGSNTYHLKHSSASASISSTTDCSNVTTSSSGNDPSASNQALTSAFTSQSSSTTKRPSNSGHRHSSTLNRPVKPSQQRSITPRFKSNAHEAQTYIKGISKKLGVLAHEGEASGTSLGSLFSEFCNALQQGKTEEAVRLWGRLRSPTLTLQFTARHYNMTGELITNLMSPKSQMEWTEDSIRSLEQIAMTIVEDRPRALLSCMIWHIRAGFPDRAIALYEDYEKRYAKTHPWLSTAGPHRSVKDPATDGLVEIKTDKQADIDEHRLTLALGAVVALASQQSFGRFLDMFRDSPVCPGLSQEAMSNFFHEHMRTAPQTLYDQANMFVNSLHHAKLIEVPTLLEYKVGKLTSKQDVPALKHLYKEIMSGLHGPHQWLKATKGAQAPHHAILMPESAWASFIFAFLHCGQTGLGGGVWEDMLGLGLTPGAPCWNALISAHGTSGDYAQCKHQFAVMKKQGINPDAHSYRAMIFSLYSAHKCEDAMTYFEEFRGLEAGFSVEHRLMVYNVTLNGLLRHVKEDPQNEAISRRLFDTMRANGPKPDLRSCNILLAYYGRRKMLKACAQTLEIMTSDGLVGDVYTYTIILSAMLRAGRVDAREIVLRTMRAQGIQPNSGTYTNIITDMVKDGTEENIVDAMNEITRLEASRDKDVHPNEITYTAVINAIVRNTDLSPQLKDDYIQHLRDRMKHRGIVPNRTTFHNLIAASLDDPLPTGVHRAMAYYKEMGERGIHMVQDSWYILIQGMANRGEYGLAHQLIRDMVISGFRPSGSLLRVVDRVRMEAR